VVKVLDFGLVKALDAEKQSALTAANSLTGTPHYMSPEAIQDPDRVDARSDLYAVGAVGYFLLTGTPVFDGKSAVAVCTHHLQTAPEPPSQRLGKSIAGDLEAILLSCLEKNPDSRPASARELAAALDACEDARTWTDADAEQWWRKRGGAGQRQEFEYGATAAGATLIVGRGGADETR
jgi:eukaryotic-like serine/threonine-protein kinase